MKLRLLILTIVLGTVLSGLAACRPLESNAVATPDAEKLIQTSVVLVTQSFERTQAQVEYVQTATGALPTATTQPTVIPTIARTPTPLQSPTSELPCHRVGAGTPFDVTIPDETPFLPGQSFVKIWRLVNTGSCKWSRLYKLVFFSGNSMGAIQSYVLQNEVPPGGVVDLPVEMFAPMQAGFYQGNWMMQSSEGLLFGLGPNGDAPFWARIEVVEQTTATAAPSPTSDGTAVFTPTP